MLNFAYSANRLVTSTYAYKYRFSYPSPQLYAFSASIGRVESLIYGKRWYTGALNGDKLYCNPFMHTFSLTA